MGIVAYFVHVDAEQLAAVREKPAIIFQMSDIPRFQGAELIDIDKDWQVVPWLLSDKKREEQKLEAATIAALRRDDTDKPGAFERALAEERRRLGVTTTPEAAQRMPDDAALVAFEGRGTAAQRDEQIDLGLGGARVFSPPEVTALSSELSRIQEGDLRRSFDRREMARWDVGGMEWLTEPDSVLDDFLLPAFTRIQSFYKRAADSGHYVLVVLQ